MAEDFNNKALRGSISQILLNALVSGDKYGYEICKDIEQKSNGKLMLKQPSLYSSLRRMEGQGLITSYWADSDLGGRRHYYSITEKGRKHYEKKQVNWNEFGDLINALPTNADSDKVETANLTDFDTIGQEIKNTTNDAQSDFGVVKQENLFSMAKSIPAKKQDISSGGETFIQFDMFAQKPNFIKTTAETPEESFSTFKSKYSTLTGSIEPTESETSDSVIDVEEFDIDESDDITTSEDVLESVIPDEAEDEISEDIFAEKSDDEDIEIKEVETTFSDDIENSNQDSDDDIINQPLHTDSFEEDFIDSVSEPIEDTSKSGSIKDLPKDYFDNTISELLVSGKSKPSAIIDSSDKYSTKKRDFDTYSFTDKQQQEQYVPTGKFAYRKDSENIYGSDFSAIESESLKGSLSDFLGDSAAEEEKPNDISSLFKFTEEDNQDVFVSEDKVETKATIDDVIPQPKPLEEYDEVLKDHERIDVPLYTSTQENKVEFIGTENNGSFIQKPEKKETLNYKDKLADLYTDTSKVNPYNKPLAEETVSLDSKEIFESPKPAYKPNFTSDLETLQNDLNKDGIKLRIYNKSAYAKTKQDNYINYSLLSLIKGWIVWFIMLIEIIVTAVILHTNQLLPVAQVSFYYWAGGLTLLYPLYYTLAYFIDPYKKVVSTFKLNISLFNKFLAMLINIIFIFALNLFFGMTSLNQLSYLSYWLLPIVLTSNYIISTLIYFILLKGKKFSI